jgi:hypothetical protein
VPAETMPSLHGLRPPGGIQFPTRF